MWSGEREREVGSANAAAAEPMASVTRRSTSRLAVRLAGRKFACKRETGRQRERESARGPRPSAVSTEKHAAFPSHRRLDSTGRAARPAPPATLPAAGARGGGPCAAACVLGGHGAK